jgi:hypothetical protein
MRPAWTQGSPCPRPAALPPSRSRPARPLLQDLLDACQRPATAALLPGGPGGVASSGLGAVNGLVAHHLTAALWPLEAADAQGGVGRLRDVVRPACAVRAALLPDGRGGKQAQLAVRVWDLCGRVVGWAWL